MADIKVNRDSKLIQVLAAEARHERLDSNVVEEANKIISELSKDMSPENRYQIAQTIAFTVDELQQKELDFLNRVADIKNVNDGEKAMFNVKAGTVKAYKQAKGSTTARSMVAGRQVEVPTFEISCRPAINVLDLRTGRVNMADLIREANTEMTHAKMKEVERVLHAAMTGTYNKAPFYGAGTGIVKATLDPMLSHFRTYGNGVTIMGDQAAVSQLAPIAGMAMNAGTTQFSNEMINEANENGFLGRYNGCDVIAMNNAFDANTINPILATDWLYIMPNGATADARNLKLVNEGSVRSIDSQSIDDMVYEVRLDQSFGAAFVVGEYPSIGAYKIN